MKKFLIAASMLMLAACTPEISEQAKTQEQIEAMTREYALSQGCDGVINEKYGCVSEDFDPSDIASSSSSTEAQIPSSSSSSSEQSDWQEVVLVDQNYGHVANFTSLDKLRAMQTKIIRGTLEEATLTFELDRGENRKGFSAVAMYQMPYNDGKPQPQLEWKSFPYVDSQWVGNCKRNLSPKSHFTTLGQQHVTATYDLSAFPTTTHDLCSTEILTHDFVNAFNGEYPDVDFAFGFMPSDLNANLKVTLRYRGNLEITNF